VLLLEIKKYQFAGIEYEFNVISQEETFDKVHPPIFTGLDEIFFSSIYLTSQVDRYSFIITEAEIFTKYVFGCLFQYKSQALFAIKDI
jgi:hypothetical protein